MNLLPSFLRVVLPSCLIFFVAFFASIGQAQNASSYPALSGRVVDNAAIISASEEALIKGMLAALEEKTGDQVVVLTIPSLKGANLENYSLSVARKWALGEKEKNNGVLFLIAKNDRKMRIEVGYGLEGKLTDAIASYIIRNDVAPAFRSGDFSGGIKRGVNSIVNVLATDASGLKQWETRAKPRKSKRNSTDKWGFYFIVGIWIFIIFGSAISSWLVRKLGREIKPGHYRWLGMDAGPNAPKRKRRRDSHGRYVGGSTWGGGSGGGFGGSSGGFGGGGGGFGGGGSSGGW